jgi:thiamine biosynthesis lipoprotein
VTSPTALPELLGGADPADVPDIADTVTSFPSMACTVNVRLGAGTPWPDRVARRVAAVFGEVEAQCTRFNPASPLMRANGAGDAWYPVPTRCYAAIREAARAYRATGGRFDPRVLRALHAIGYDRTLAFASGSVVVDGGAPLAGVDTPWEPGFDAARPAVRIGAVPIDLGGIGKGLALRWAVERIRDECSAFLLEAGGDCYLAGDGPSGDGWQVAVEDPRGYATPVAVLSLRDTACATSSTRIRRWVSGGRPVHHLIDPRTGAPGGAGLLSVTVLGADPAMSEVWSKVLFLSGRDAIAEATAARSLVAMWVTDGGTVEMTPQMASLVIWQGTA